MMDPKLEHLRFTLKCDTSRCRGKCCGKGVMADLGEQELILKHAADIRGCMPSEYLCDPAQWFEKRVVRDKDFPSGKAVSTCVTERGCVFLNRNMRCVLGIVSEKLGVELRPFFCRTYPLTIRCGTVRFDERQFLMDARCCEPVADGVKTLEASFPTECALVSTRLLR